MEKIKIENKKDKIRLILSGELMVEDAIDLKKNLDELLPLFSEIEIEFKEDFSGHAAVFQLLLALEKYCQQQNKQLKFLGLDADEIKEQFETIGITNFN